MLGEGCSEGREGAREGERILQWMGEDGMIEREFRDESCEVVRASGPW